MKSGEVQEYLQKTLDSSFKGAVFAYHSNVLYLNMINKQNFSYSVLNEAFVTNPVAFYFTKNFYLVEEFNTKISQCKANGLINFWLSKYASSTAQKAVDFPSRMTVKHLQGTFEVLLYGLIGALIAFVLELNFERLRIFHAKMKF